VSTKYAGFSQGKTEEGLLTEKNGGVLEKTWKYPESGYGPGTRVTNAEPRGNAFRNKKGKFIGGPVVHECPSQTG